MRVCPLFPEVQADRLKARNDRAARMYRHEYHDALAHCSKDELIDLICDLCANDYSNGVDVPLKDKIDDALNSVLLMRYDNRHPEKIAG